MARRKTVFGNTVYNITDKVVVSNAELLAINTTPKVLLPAQGANILTIPRRVILRHNFLTAAFGTNTTLELKHGSKIVDLASSILTSSATEIDIEDLAGLWDDVAADTALELLVKTGNPFNGGGSLDAWLMYETIDVS